MDWTQVFAFVLIMAMLLITCAIAGYGIAKELVRKSCLVDRVDYKKEDEIGCRCVAFLCFLFPPIVLFLLVMMSFVVNSAKYEKALSRKDLDKIFCFKIN